MSLFNIATQCSSVIAGHGLPPITDSVSTDEKFRELRTDEICLLIIPT